MNFLLNNCRFMLRSWCGRHPSLLNIIGKIRGFDTLICHDKTDLVIEGYPRSANTYCSAAFYILFESRIKIARHMHASAQFHLAERMSKPSILLIRNPLDAIASLSIRRPEVDIKLLIREYIIFHSEILKLLNNKNRIKILTFEDVINDPNKIIELAKNIACSMHLDSISIPNDFQSSVSLLVEEMERNESGGDVRETHVARPSAHRLESSKFIKTKIRAEKVLFEAATDVYEKVLAVRL